MHLDWFASVLTVTGMELVARQKWFGWVVLLCNQVLWVALIFERHLWGLAPLTVVLSWRYSSALVRWRNH
jgi:hypothetical protein